MNSSRKARRWLTILVIVGVVLLGTVPAWAQVTNPVTNTDTGETFATIQAAINDANTLNGHTITVADGTYTITSVIGVNKGVTITGDVGNPENVLVQYAAPQSTNNGFEITANNVIVQGIKAINGKRGFYLNGVTGCKVSNCIVSACADQGIYVRNCPATSEATRVEVTGNIASDCGNTWGSACIQTYVSPYTYIYNNMINATEDKGINIIRSGATGTADRVQVIGNTISETKWPGIQVIGSPYTYVYDNTLTKCNYYGADGTGDWDYASIHVQDDIGPTYSNHTIIDSNTVSDGINGIQLWSDSCTVTNNTIYDMGLTYADTKTTTDGAYYNSAILYGDMYDVNMPTSATISNNNIYDNYWGLFVISTYTGTVDASSNWWGTTDPTVVAGLVSSLVVDFTPMLNSGADADPGTPGWQPDLSSLIVHTLGQQVGGTGRIQEGINLVTSSTVKVVAGTYPAKVYVNKSATVTGEQAGVDARGRTGVPESIINPKEAYVVVVQADNVTIDGFEIMSTVDWNCDNAGIYVSDDIGEAGEGGTWTTNIIIKNNRIHDLTDGNRDGGQGIHGIVVGPKTDGVELAYNEIYNLHLVDDKWGYTPVGVMIWGNPGEEAKNTHIHDNLIHDLTNDNPATQPRGIQASMYSENVTIDRNEIYNVARGIQLHSYAGGAINVADNYIHDCTVRGLQVCAIASVTGNVITGCPTGVWIKPYGSPHYTDLLVDLHYNSISGNTNYGVEAMTNVGQNVSANATLNWWGSANGPIHVTNTNATTGDAVSDYVIFSPWLGTGPDGNPAAPGVQITGPMLIIVAPVGPEPTGGYLNAAIGAANSADLPFTDTIEVRHGTYDGSEPITEAVNIVSETGSASHTTLNGNMSINGNGVLIGLPLQGFRVNGNLTVGAGANAATSRINWCDFYGLMTNNGTGTFDAQYNYWGTQEVAVVDGRTTGDIDYDPFLPKNADDSYVDATAIIAAGLASGIDPAIDQLWLMVQLGQDVGTFIQYQGVAGAGAFGGAPVGAEINLGGAVGGGGAVEGAISGTYAIGDPIDGRFTLTDPVTGEPITDAAVTTSLLGPDGALVSWGCATYDETTGEYVFTIDTSGLSPGTYELIIQTDDGQSKTVSIEVQAA